MKRPTTSREPENEASFSVTRGERPAGENLLAGRFIYNISFVHEEDHTTPPAEKRNDKSEEDSGSCKADQNSEKR